MGADSALGNKRHKHSERGDDLYQTPPEAVHALLRVEDIPDRVHEPACGPGAIAKVLRETGRDVWATDLVDYRDRAVSEQNEFGMDFLMTPSCFRTTAIVTNPPYKLAQQFVQKALTHAPYVAMLLRLAFLESERRRPILDDPEIPLARVHVFRKRLPMMHRDGWQGRKANSGMAFAWFVWDASHSGPTELHRLSWEK